jgi:hypothetical protein
LSATAEADRLPPRSLIVSAVALSAQRAQERENSMRKGNSVNNGPVPKHLLSQAVIDAKAISHTFWDLI